MDYSPSFRAMSAGRDCATSFKNLLELVHQIVLKPSADKRARLPGFSKEVANGVGEVVQAAEVLKGNVVLPSISLIMSCDHLSPGEGWVDTKDPNVIAETELLQAAASIEAAAKKLSELKPRRKAVSLYIIIPPSLTLSPSLPPLPPLPPSLRRLTNLSTLRSRY